MSTPTTPAAEEVDYLGLAIAAVERLRYKWDMANENPDGANWSLAVAAADFITAADPFVPRSYWCSECGRALRQSLDSEDQISGMCQYCLNGPLPAAGSGVR